MERITVNVPVQLPTAAIVGRKTRGGPERSDGDDVFSLFISGGGEEEEARTESPFRLLPRTNGKKEEKLGTGQCSEAHNAANVCRPERGPSWMTFIRAIRRPLPYPPPLPHAAG